MRTNDLQFLAEEYVHSVLCIEDMRKCGIFAVYGLEQQRVAAHARLCAALDLNVEDTKHICLYLDKEIGLPYGTLLDQEELSVYARRLLDRLYDLKDTRTKGGTAP